MLERPTRFLQSRCGGVEVLGRESHSPGDALRFADHVRAAPNVLDCNDEVLDLYSVTEDCEVKTTPFKHTIHLKDSSGHNEQVLATWDDGCMACAMSVETYERLRLQGALGGWRKSKRRLRMANGDIVKPVARWAGRISVGGAEMGVEMEVFDSGGAWDLLLGKPAMVALRMLHDYGDDSVMVPGVHKRLENEAVEAQERGVLGGDSDDGVRGVLEGDSDNGVRGALGGDSDDGVRGALGGDSDKGVRGALGGVSSGEARGVLEGDTEHAQPVFVAAVEEAMVEGLVMEEGVEQPDIKGSDDSSLFTRLTDPFKEERVAEVLRLIKIGDDLSPEDRAEVEDLVRNFADIFALSLSEVNAVEGAVHTLNIPQELHSQRSSTRDH